MRGPRSFAVGTGGVCSVAVAMSARGERTIRQAYRAFAERDLEGLIALSDEAIEVSTVTGLLSGRTEPYRGYEGLAAVHARHRVDLEANRAPASAVQSDRR